MALVIPKDGELFLAELLRRGLPLAPTVGLFSGPTVIGPDTTLADLTEATFGGYARIVLPAWAAAVLTPDGAALLVAGPVVFKQTVAPPNDTVTGYFMVQLDWTLTPRLIGAERFGKNLPFRRKLQELKLTVPLSGGSFF